MSEAAMTRVFVYGTLQRGDGNHRVIEAASYLGEARTAPAFTLVSLGPFPALVAGGITTVLGEVYEVDAGMLAQLDRLEGCPRFYQRHPIVLDDGTRVEAYLQRVEQVQGRSKVASGNWRDYRKERRCRFG